MNQKLNKESRKKVGLNGRNGKSLKTRSRIRDTILEFKMGPTEDYTAEFKIYQNNKEHLKNVKKIKEEMKEKNNE